MSRLTKFQVRSPSPSRHCHFINPLNLGASHKTTISPVTGYKSSFVVRLRSTTRDEGDATCEAAVGMRTVPRDTGVERTIFVIHERVYVYPALDHFRLNVEDEDENSQIEFLSGLKASPTSTPSFH
ncbi:hypothetical protein PAXRUDRAFT_565554 [Paxillus rubicundulus Ve08.2h10]|uniref:Uncharacterized protein n=1 Tax=Paxillus rubicundulus Ve08.2h10 TaxID=930991 RepID=A0A0D0DZK7_9AGAM|nr:hypothetical protein PAXRUDRAFT_565554 [Paxillus rubicundulus Ve08.2h10]